MIAKMRNLGEACTAANRFYVHEAVHEAFTEKFTAKMAALKMGNGLEPDVDVGPLVNADTRDKVAHFVEDAVAKGARLRPAARSAQRAGLLLSADRADERARRRRCVRDEIFGPVAAIQTFRRGGRDPPRQRHRIRAGRLCLHRGHEARDAGLREARLRHGRAEPRARVRPGGAVRRRQAVGPRPRRRPRGHEGVPWRPSTSRSAGIASPATRAHAARQGVDLEALARRTGRTTLAREDVDGTTGATGDSAAGPAAPSADQTRYWAVDHAQYGPVRDEAMGRMAQLAAPTCRRRTP
jgi:pyruvate/2-oxoglutarate dehydrogenase complex dihydrolipoamide acyltransferase (E2) component